MQHDLCCMMRSHAQSGRAGVRMEMHGAVHKRECGVGLRQGRKWEWLQMGNSAKVGAHPLEHICGQY